MDEIRQMKRAHIVVADFDMLDTSTTEVVIMILQPFWLVNLNSLYEVGNRCLQNQKMAAISIRAIVYFVSLLFFYKVLYNPSMYNTPSN